MRGDNVPVASPTAASAGPPPHAWGQRSYFAFRSATLRSTPTCVGTTRLGSTGRISLAVHPHMRGDNEEAVFERASRNGPPPHAWGQPGSHRGGRRRVGSTPTCVG